MSDKSKPSELDRATRLVRRICRIAGEPRLIDGLTRDLARRGVRSAILRRDTPVLFDWLLETISYQASATMSLTATWSDMAGCDGARSQR